MLTRANRVSGLMSSHRVERSALASSALQHGGRPGCCLLNGNQSHSTNENWRCADRCSAKRCLFEGDEELHADDLTSRDTRELEEAERRQIPQEMKEVLNSFRSLADGQLAVHQVSYKQGMALRHLRRRSSCNVTELATVAGVDLAAMTRMLERLEAKGLVERRRSSIDRRMVYFSLLGAGATVAALAEDVLASVTKEHLRHLAQQECVQLREFLERMRANGQALGDG